MIGPPRHCSVWVVWLIASVLFSPALACASEANMQFERANEAYRQANYDAAARMYQEILEQGANGSVYYNLGNTWMKLGHLGEARWSYIKAYRFLGADPDLEMNRSILQSALPPSALSKSYTFPAWMRWAAFGNRYPASFWGMILASLFWLLLVLHGLIRWFFPSVHIVRVVAVAAAVLFLLIGAAYGTQKAAERIPLAVVLEPTQAKFGPQESAGSPFLLEEGTLIRLGRRSADWIQIFSAQEQAGWVQISKIKSLE